MSDPIWSVITENLAEQMSATQGGTVHASQLLPYLPANIGLIETTLDALTDSDRVSKKTVGELNTYIFKESLNTSPRKFGPRNCIYSDEPLTDHEYTVLSPSVRKKIEAELSILAQSQIWPAEAVWQHELLYLVNNLNAPISTSAIAGHSRLSFKKVEQRLDELKRMGVISFNSNSSSWESATSRYPKPAYLRNDEFIRQFPGAVKEELEIRLIKALAIACGVLALGLVLAITAKFPFPLVAIGSITAAIFIFVKILKAPPKPMLDIY